MSPSLAPLTSSSAARRSWCSSAACTGLAAEARAAYSTRGSAALGPDRYSACRQARRIDVSSSVWYACSRGVVGGRVACRGRRVVGCDVDVVVVLPVVVVVVVVVEVVVVLVVRRARYSGRFCAGFGVA